jgi:hypothetical protein
MVAQKMQNPCPIMNASRKPKIVKEKGFGNDLGSQRLITNNEINCGLFHLIENLIYGQNSLILFPISWFILAFKPLS